jgi:aryl carrier-like protein
MRNVTLTKNEITTVDISPLYYCRRLVQLGLDSDVSMTASAKLKKVKPPLALRSLVNKINWK